MLMLSCPTTEKLLLHKKFRAFKWQSMVDSNRIDEISKTEHVEGEIKRIMIEPQGM